MCYYDGRHAQIERNLILIFIAPLSGEQPAQFWQAPGSANLYGLLCIVFSASELDIRYAFRTPALTGHYRHIKDSVRALVLDNRPRRLSDKNLERAGARVKTGDT